MALGTRLAMIATILFVFTSLSRAENTKLKVLIIDGQKNHDWRVTTPILRRALADCGRFTVDIVTAPSQGGNMVAFRPEFAAYDAVISNYSGDPWPQETQGAFVDYVQSGGGFVVVHAANNAFPNWPQYNTMIGLGGWGGRDERSGPYVYFRIGKLVRDDSPGPGGHHGQQHEFQIVVREAEHPITRDMPTRWMHTQDELYDQLRGPAKKMTVLATAFSDPATSGTGRDGDRQCGVRFPGNAFPARGRSLGRHGRQSGLATPGGDRQRPDLRSRIETRVGPAPGVRAYASGSSLRVISDGRFADAATLNAQPTR